MAKTTSCVPVLYVAAIVVVLAVVLGGKALQRYHATRHIELVVINPTDRPYEVMLDDRALAPAEHRQRASSDLDVHFYEMTRGKHRLTIQDDGRIILEENRNFQSDESYVAYCGGRWLRDAVLEYHRQAQAFSGGARFVELPKSYELRIDGHPQEIVVENQDQLEFYTDVVQQTTNFVTVPRLFAYQKERRAILPGEEIPQTISMDSDNSFGSSTSLRILRVMPTADIDRLRAMLRDEHEPAAP